MEFWVQLTRTYKDEKELQEVSVCLWHVFFYDSVTNMKKESDWCWAGSKQTTLCAPRLIPSLDLRNLQMHVLMYIQTCGSQGSRLLGPFAIVNDQAKHDVTVIQPHDKQVTTSVHIAKY